MGPGTSHLGERAAALVDGELGDAERERALAHVAVCESCRSEVEAQRRLKARLDSLHAVEAPSGLESRLLALAVPLTPPLPPAQPGPGPFPNPWTLGPPTAPVGFAVSHGGPARAAMRTGPRRRRPLLAAAATAAVAGVAAFAVVSAGPGPQRTVDPGADVFVVEHVSSTRGPLADPAAGTLPVPAASADSDIPGER